VSKNTFSASMNCYTWGRFDVAQCLEQLGKTPIRLVELPTEQCRPGCLVPELMLDAPLDGQWQYSLPDLKVLLARGGFRTDAVDVFGYTGYPGSDAFIKRRIDFAAALGANLIVLGCHHKALSHIGQTSCREESEEAKAARRYIYAMLRDLGDYGKAKGVRIALEIHAGVTATADEALRTMAEVNRDNVGINFDTANILFYNESLDSAGAARDLRRLARHVFHVHLKDIRRGKTRNEHVLPRLGTGEVDFRQVFDILHGVNFYGPFSFEVETFHGDTESNDIASYHEDLVASIEYVCGLGEFEG
jgi:sugar phosphate isomerase/epimerase